MQAAYYHGKHDIRAGSCQPVAPGPGQVQIAVSHCGICGTDLHLFHGHMDHRVKPPQVIGHEMSGAIAEVGPGVSSYKHGDRVTVMPLDPCNDCPACKAGHSHVCQRLKFIGIDTPGALQALWTVPAHTLHRIPDSLSLRHAALIEPIAVACHDVRLGRVTPGEFAVVLGGGPIGALVALVAKAAGARVLISEINPFRIALARKLGLEVVNPLETDLVKLVTTQTNGAGADVVFEVSGSTAGAEIMTQLPRVRGRVVIVAVFPKPVPVDLHKFFWRELSLCGTRVYEHEDFEKAIQLAAARAFPFEELITGVYPLEGVTKGLEQMEQGGEVMKILVECST
ncbi:MAG: zinc-binding dehydrogenase [Acidimicrobiia bacterium]|nr:zinc-binding dehydrogenase [Acidimicrobiia bacterium]